MKKYIFFFIVLSFFILGVLYSKNVDAATQCCGNGAGCVVCSDSLCTRIYYCSPSFSGTCQVPITCPDGSHTCGSCPPPPTCTPNWGSCSASCGTGIQYDGCGHSRYCNTQACCDSNSWGSCSVACGGGTQTNACGGTRSCNTQSCCTSTNPGAATLSSPSTGSAIPNNSVNLSWTDATGWGTGCPQSNQYKVFLSASCTGTYTQYATLPQGTLSTTASGLNWGTTYCWFVQKTNGSNNANSAVWNFTINSTPTETSHSFTQADTCSLSSGISGRWDNSSGLTENPITYSVTYQDTESDQFLGSFLVFVPTTGTYSENNTYIDAGTLFQKSANSKAIAVDLNPGGQGATLKNDGVTFAPIISSGDETNENGTGKLIDVGVSSKMTVSGNSSTSIYKIRFENTFPSGTYNVYGTVYMRNSDGTEVSSYATGSNNFMFKKLDTWTIDTTNPTLTITGPSYNSNQTLNVTYGASDNGTLSDVVNYITRPDSTGGLRDNTIGQDLQFNFAPNTHRGSVNLGNYLTAPTRNYSDTSTSQGNTFNFRLDGMDSACNYASVNKDVSQPTPWLYAYQGNISANQGFSVNIPDNPSFTVPFTGTYQSTYGNGTIPGDIGTAPIAYWKFDESSGSIISDSSNSGYTATISSGSFSTGRYGNAFTKNGSGAGATLSYTSGSTLNFNSSSKLSVVFWLKSSVSHTSRLLEVPSAGGLAVEYIGSSFRFAVFGGNVVSVNAIQFDGLWHQYAVVYDGAYAYFYRDGVLLSQQNFVGNWYATANKTFYIGGDASYPLNGSIDEAEIYNYARSASEVAYSYSKGLPIANWKFNEGTGTTVSDSSGGNNGTFSGTGTSWVSGVEGTAGNFNGSNSVSTNSSIGNFGTRDFSIEFWIKTNSAATSYIISKRLVCTHASFWNLIYGNGYISMELDQDASGTNYKGVSTSQQINDNNWHFITITRSGPSISMYVDSVLKGSGSTGGVTNLGNTANFVMATNPCIGVNGSVAFTGALDNVQFYNYVKSSDQIVADFSGSGSIVGGDTGTPYLATFSVVSGTPAIPSLRISKSDTYAINYIDESVAPSKTTNFTKWYDLVKDRVEKNKATTIVKKTGNMGFGGKISTLIGVSPGSKTILEQSGDLSLGASTCDVKAIILVGGNLTINPELKNDTDSSACMFVIKGNISVTSVSVKSPYISVSSSTPPNYEIVDAYLVTDGTFSSNTNNLLGSSYKYQGLYILGGVVAKTLNLHRDLNYQANLTDPGVVIKYDPKFIAIFSADIADRSYSFREIQ